MNNVSAVLETLWTYEKVMATPILSIDEKRVVVNELIASIPHPMHSTGMIGTRDIVVNHLTPPSKDEAPIGNASKTTARESEIVPHGTNNHQKEADKKARPIRR